MSILLGVRSYLLSRTSITGLARPQTIGGIQYDGVFCRTVPEGFLPPFVIVKRSGDFDPLECMDGTTGLQATTLDVIASCRSDVELESLSQAVQDSLKDYTGPAGPDDTIKAVNWMELQDTEFEEGQGGNQFQYAATNTFRVFHQPTRGA